MSIAYPNNSNFKSVAPNSTFVSGLSQPDGDQDPEAGGDKKANQIKLKMKNKIAKMKQDIKEKKERKRAKKGQVVTKLLDQSNANTDGGKDQSDSDDPPDVSINYENPYVNENYMDSTLNKTGNFYES